MNKTSFRKLEWLKNILSKMEGVLVAYSGGVDSTFLLKIAKGVLHDKVLAVIASSPTYPRQEIMAARKLAKKLKARHIIINTYELRNPSFVRNPVKRCYFCKQELFNKLKLIARRNNLKYVCDGSNLDDLKDFRPGAIAKKELGIRSPLQEARLTKEEIRGLSHRMKLPTWNKPSFACLASRFPYKTQISAVLLKRIGSAEEYLRKLHFRQVRVRHHKNLARIEVDKNDLTRLLRLSKKIIKKFQRLGYTYVTADLAGYRTGSMNEPLKKPILDNFL